MHCTSLATASESPRPRRRRHTWAMLIVALQGLPLAAGAVGRAIDFAPAVQASTENARITIANLKNLAGGIPPGPCKGAIAFYDAEGTLLTGHSVAFSLMPGAAIAVNSPYASAFGGLFLQRARVTFPAAPKTGIDTCGGLGANYEVFDTSTLQTRVMNPGVIHGFNPQPDPPGALDEP